jgi:sugar O-acyltransferase (sialic acid O-acetyltransferase NeuD family)
MVDVTKSRRLVILGTGGNYLDVLDTVNAINARQPSWHVAGFLDDTQTVGTAHLGITTLGGLRDAPKLAGPGGPLADALFITAIGSERNHARRLEILLATGLPAHRFATLVHPAASVSAWAEIGRGCCITFGASVGGRVNVGDHVWLGPGCVVGHDSLLEPGAIMAPRATISGFVRLGACCYVGSGATVRQRVVVGERALVGLGAVVLHDVEPNTTVVGNPARALHHVSLPSESSPKVLAENSPG